MEFTEMKPAKPTVHIVGAGLAGLSAAVQLAGSSWVVRLYEASPQAGGRCRSFYDDVLGRRIDNGNHLMLSGNRALGAYLQRLGASDRLGGPDSARFEFYDRTGQQRWKLDFGSGMVPWSLMRAENRVPGSRLRDYMAGLLRIRRAGHSESVEACLSGTHGDLYECLWHPLATAVLNTDPREAQATLLWSVFRQAFARGGQSARPLIARDGLSEALVNPAIDYLERHGAEVCFNTRLVSVDTDDRGVARLNFTAMKRPVAPGDKVIFALPPWIVADLIDIGPVPDDHRPIINGHFLLPEKIDKLTIIGLINATSQWVFAQGDVASVTISAAGPLMDLASEKIAARMWPDICAVLDLGDIPLGACRIIREKRATIAQIPAQAAMRPGCHVRSLRNLLLAGDWTATGLPATIEGAILSGKTAAQAVAGR